MKKLIGHIGVDAGLCWIGDPCYVLGDDATSRVHSWDSFCNKIKDMDNHATPLGPHTGVVVSTGFGDGQYPVYAEISDEGSWGKRVKSVTIDFIWDEDEV